LRKKEVVISSVFIALIVIVFSFSFYFGESDNEGMDLVSARAVKSIDGFTNKLSSISGLVVIFLIATSVLVALDYKKIAKV
jgi:hypothetical protein